MRQKDTPRAPKTIKSLRRGLSRFTDEAKRSSRIGTVPGTGRKPKPAGISEKVINILKIYTMIVQNQYPSVERLIDRFNLSKRTIYRYLEIINSIDKVEVDEEKKGYKFIHGDRIKKLLLSEDDFIMLLALSDTVTHLGVPLRDSFQKFTEKMVSVSKTPAHKQSVPIVVKIPDAIENEQFSDYFKTISLCIENMRSIDVVYTTRDSKEVKDRRIDPYGLVFHDGSWILIGYCHLREDIRRFALDRIMSLKETNLYFKMKEDFNLEKNLSHSWGIYDEKDVNVVVRFSSEIADLITRKKRWHASEKRAILPNGDVELSFTVAGVREIKKWIYTWLPYAEVIGPEWFREQINKELGAATKKHRKQ